jgi:hypothetical protein
VDLVSALRSLGAGPAFGGGRTAPVQHPTAWRATGRHRNSASKTAGTALGGNSAARAASRTHYQDAEHAAITGATSEVKGVAGEVNDVDVSAARSRAVDIPDRAESSTGPLVVDAHPNRI